MVLNSHVQGAGEEEAGMGAGAPHAAVGQGLATRGRAEGAFQWVFISKKKTHKTKQANPSGDFADLLESCPALQRGSCPLAGGNAGLREWCKFQTDVIK